MVISQPLGPLPFGVAGPARLVPVIDGRLISTYQPQAAHKCRISIVINVCPSRHMGNSSNSDRRGRHTQQKEERAEWNIRMNTILYFSPCGAVYETRAYTKADIAQLVHDQGLQCLTSADRQFVFWFTPSTRRCQRRANQSATDYC